MADQACTLQPGELVVCTYRMPPPLQPWIHPIRIGVVEEPGDDPASWNAINSERAYCESTGKVRVRYYDRDGNEASFVQHDSADSLIKITDEEARLTGVDAVRHFLGAVVAHHWERAQLGKKP